MREVATIVFSGALDPERFVAFAEHRARRLDIEARLGAVGPGTVTVTVEGEPDLIDAFEMACSLGPVTCIVRDVARRAGTIGGGDA